MLEIGVSKGGSLAMWRSYFGPRATIYGIDVNPDCAGYVDGPNQVRIGSQDDPDFLRRVVKEMGGIDVVLDDGSHVARHQQTSFETLFPLLNERGLYAIEDLHTAYWPNYGGGYGRQGSAIELLKRSVDDIHHWYHPHPPAAGGADVAAVHFHDSIAVVEKGGARRPIHAQMGRKEDLLNPGDS
ncbi:MAG TPA: class I SAM-dependent methyltransferase [Allosphingosinicella sp.]|nr:class I SAM-dependent methyltransferase [Allosphingosinicella sp.]